MDTNVAASGCKVCRLCLESLPATLDYFSYSSAQADKLRPTCKRCTDEALRSDVLKRHRRRGFMSPTYITWMAMRQRCLSPKAIDYARYGGRGIKVCSQWASFWNFLRDMGERLEGTTLERLDVNGDYTPDNCKWATSEEQCNNKRNNTRLTLNGRTQTIVQWAREIGVKPSTISQRLRKGASVEDALSQRVRSRSEAARIGNKIRWGK